MSHGTRLDKEVRRRLIYSSLQATRRLQVSVEVPRMERNWFRRFGFVYLPKGLTGWLLTLATAFITVRTFLMVDRHSHSASDTLIGALPIVALLLLLLWLVAAGTSNQKPPT